MTQRVSRRRIAEAVTFALASMSCGVLVAGPSPASKPSSATFEAPMLCAAGAQQKSDTQPGMALRPGLHGWTLTEVDAKNADACQLKATSANLNVLFEGNGSNAVLLRSAPMFAYAAGGGLPARRLEIDAIEPLLCESFYPLASPDLLALTITDPNGRVQSLRGVQSVGYRPPVAGDATSGRFSPASAQAAYGAQIQCYGVPYSTLSAGAADVPAPGIALADAIFGSGFEIQGPPSQRADLRVEILDGDPGNPAAYLTRNLAATINSPVNYSIRVRNAGPVAASGLRLKEFLVDTAAPAPQLTPRVEALGWTCRDRGPGVAQSDPGTDCGTGSGVLNVGGAGFSLQGGASRTYTLTRNFPATLGGGAPNAEDGDRSVLAAAVFFDPSDATGQGDVSVAENLASALFTLTENPGPTIACSADSGNASPHDVGAIQSPITLQEDAAALNYDCLISDPDGVASFTAGSSNDDLIDSAGLLGARAGDSWPLSISLEPDVSGSSILSFTATDSLGATRPLAVTVNVAEVNDEPSFDILGVDTSDPLDGVVDRRIARIGLLGSGGVPRLYDQSGGEIDLFSLPPGNSIVVQRDPNCGGGSACSIRIVDFFRFVDAGPPAEAAVQQVQAQATACDPAATASLFFTDPRSSVALPSPHSAAGALRPSGSNFDLVFTYDKSLVGSLNGNCNFRFGDNGSPVRTSIDSLSREVLFQGFAGS